MMSFSVSAILPASPVHSPGRRAEKSPFLNAINVFSNSFALSESVVRVWVLMFFSFRRFQNREEQVDDQRATRVSHVMRPQSGITAPAARGINCLQGIEKRRVGGLVVTIVIPCGGRFCKPYFRGRRCRGGNSHLLDARALNPVMNHHCKVSATELHFRKFRIRYELIARSRVMLWWRAKL